MATSLRELIVSVSADTTKYQREMDRASRMGSQYFRTVQQGSTGAGRAWDMQTAAARTHATAIEASAQALGRYASMAAGAFGLGQLITMADDWGQINARIQNATGSIGEYNLAQTRLEEIASRTFRRYSEAADMFAQVAKPMQELGFTAAQTLDSAEALGLALVAGASDAQRSASAMDAWSKAMASGRINADQFQTLLQQTPRVAQALGDALGKTTGQLKEMATAGQLTASTVVPALISQMGKLGEEVERMPTTVQDATNRLLDGLQKWAGGTNQATGATQSLTEGLALVTKHIDALATVAISGGIGVIGSRMILAGKAATLAASGFVQSRIAAKAEALAVRDATLMAQLKAQADLRRAQAAMTATRGTAESARASRNLAAALLAERQATLAATQAQAAYARAGITAAGAGRAALGVLGGPAGLAITVGMVAAGWLLFRDNADSAANALDNWAGSADEAISKFRELNTEQQAGAILRLDDEISKSADSIKKALNSMYLTANADIGGSFAGPYRDAIFELKREFDAGKLSADQFSARLAELNAELLDGKPAGDRLGGTYIRLTDTIATAARETERKRGILDSFNKTNAEAQAQAGATSGAIQSQAGAFVTLGDEASKAQQRIQGALVSIPGQIARIGKSAREVAELDVADAFAAMAKDGVNFADRSNPQVQEAMRQGAEYIRLQAGLADAQRRYADSTRAASTATSDAKRKAEEARREAERQIETYNDLIAAQERQIALFGNTSKAVEVAYDAMHGALAKYTDAQKDALQQNAAWLDWLDEMADIQKAWDDGAKAQEEYGKKAGTQFDALAATADQAARNIQSYLGDSMFNILDGKFTDIGDSFEQMIKRMLSELAASQLLSVLGTAMSGYTGAGGWGDFVRGVGGSITKGAGKAGGGLAQPRTMMPVAEHGPELLQVGGQTMLMMGAQPGLVSPLLNKAGGGGGRGGAVDVTVNVHGAQGGATANVRRNDSGGLDIDVLLEQVDRHIGSNIANGTGATYQAQKSRFRLSDAL